MRTGDTWAWGEFGTRFEPLLVAYARRIGVPHDVRRELVLDLLADEGLRLAEGRGSCSSGTATLTPLPGSSRRRTRSGSRAG
jgi:hypothetical protein